MLPASLPAYVSEDSIAMLFFTLSALKGEYVKFENNDKDSITITYKRDDKLLTTKLNLIYENNIYKTGLYVKDKITGIGTLSYIDPETHIYGALGHEIVESSHNKIVEIKTGNIFKNTITSITKSISGHPGSKNAKFYKNMTYGTITKNTNKGIYGIYNDPLPSTKALPVASKDEIVVGKASILTVLENEEIKSYDIEITSINETSKTKNISFIITDNELLKKTGGVVQGMSGSPIIQNDKIIGAVTHVVVDEPKSGYGIFITSMLKEGESD